MDLKNIGMVGKGSALGEKICDTVFICSDGAVVPVEHGGFVLFKPAVVMAAVNAGLGPADPYYCGNDYFSQ